MDEISDVMVHIDPENDEQVQACSHLPLRREIEKKLATVWANIPISKEIEYITLHYLDGKIHVDLHIPLKASADNVQLQQLAESLKKAAASLENIGEVNVCFC
jgi:hypothetical protein